MGLNFSSLWHRTPPSRKVSKEGPIVTKENDGPSTNEVFPSNLPTGMTGRRIFAYIICINDYEAEKVPKLRACVEDGKKFEAFLRARFHDQALQIQSLYNKEATYDAMLSLFTKASANPSIQKGDLVIFFYAGHGSRMPGPEGWEGRIETICPCDVDTNRNGKTVYGIPDFVVGTVMTNLANTREVNVLLVFDSCHSAGMARDKTRFLQPRYAHCTPIPVPLLNELLSKYPETGGLFGKPNVNSAMSPFILLAACGKHETAHEEHSEEKWEGAFTNALINLLNKVPWHNLSYATLCKGLPKLPYQTPECIGESNRVVFSLEKTTDEGLYFDIEPNNEEGTGGGGWIVRGAGRTLGIGVGTKFIIRGPEGQNLGVLIVEKAEWAAHCLARVKLPENHQDDIPEGAKAFLDHWRLGEGPLRVALGPGVEGPLTSTEFVQLIDQPSGTCISINKRGDILELDRQGSYIAQTTSVSRLDLPKNTDSATLANILEKIARFHDHLLRRSPAAVISKVTAELCRVVKGTDGRHHMQREGPESGTRVMNSEVDIRFRPDARYGIVIKNSWTEPLYPYLFYFDPSDYAIHSIYPPLYHHSAPLAPDEQLSIGFGSSFVRPLKFFVNDGEKFDVGYLRLFVSVTPLPMEIIRQPPITNLGRHCETDSDPGFADLTPVWGARTTVIRVEREIDVDIFTLDDTGK